MRTATLMLFLSWLCVASPAQGQDISVGFTSQEIPDSVWQSMQGRSYQPNSQIHRKDLRYLRVLHWDYDNRTHQGELVCNRLIADKLIAIFRELYELHYPIQRMQLPDKYDADDERQMRDNNTSCFCYRPIAGSKRLSYHARGLAVDINPLYNPCVKQRPDGSFSVQPATGNAYTDRDKTFRYKISRNDPCHRIFLRHGFSWGGSWRSSKDYQHFEYRLSRK